MTTPIIADACPWCYTPPAPDLEAENKRLTAEVAALKAELDETLAELVDLGDKYSTLGVVVSQLRASPGVMAAKQEGEEPACSCGTHEPLSWVVVESHRFPVLTACTGPRIASEGRVVLPHRGQESEANLTVCATAKQPGARKGAGRPPHPVRALPALPAADAAIHTANHNLLRALHMVHAVAEHRKQGLNIAAACGAAGVGRHAFNNAVYGFERIAEANIPLDFSIPLPGIGAINKLAGHPHLLPKLLANPYTPQWEVALWVADSRTSPPPT